MAWAFLIIVASVLGGTLLALLPQRSDRLLGPVRTFAFASALGVVLVHLLPEALAEMGFWAFLMLPLGAIAPGALGRFGAVAWRALQPGREAPRHLALEASYVGLLLHRVGDGIGLGIYTGELSHAHGAEGVTAALGAHAVPVVAIVVLTFDSVRGRGSALKRALGLGLASVLGVLLTRSVLAESVAHASGLLSAFVAGMLLHVVSHELELQLPQTRPQKLLDLAAAALGIATSYLGGGGAAHGAHGEDELVPGGLLQLGVVASGAVALGLGGALLLGLVCRRPVRKQLASLLTGPGVAPETWVLSVVVLGPSVAALYWGGLVLSVFISRRLPGGGVWLTSAPGSELQGSGPLRALLARVEADVPYVLLAALLAATLSAAGAGGTLGLSAGAQVGLALVVAVLCYVPVAATLFLALVLLPHGLCLDAVLLLLVVGPTARRPRWGKGVLWGPGAHPVATPELWLAATGLLLAGARGALGLAVPVPVADGLGVGTTAAVVLASLLGALVTWSVARRSFRGIFAALLPPHTHPHDLAHEPGAGPTHDHP